MYFFYKLFSILIIIVEKMGRISTQNGYIPNFQRNDGKQLALFIVLQYHAKLHNGQ